MSGDNEILPGQTRPVRLIFDDNTEPSAYATNITVQHTPHEFVISFYESRPPLLLGTPEELEQQLKAIEHIFAPCVARVTVSASRMEGFVNAMRTSYENFLQNFASTEGNDD